MEEYSRYRDPLNGFSVEKPADWTVLTTPRGVGVVCSRLPLAGCWFRLAKTSNLRELVRMLIAEDERAAAQLTATGLVSVGRPLLQWREAERGILIRSVYPLSGPLLQAMGLRPQEALVSTTYVTGSGRIAYASGYSAPSSLVDALRPGLERTLKSFRFEKPMEASVLDVYDRVRGMVAYRARVPRGWAVRGAVDAMGRLVVDVRGERARVVKRPCERFMDVRMGLGLPLMLSPGLRASPYMSADQYASVVLERAGLRVARSTPEGLYPSTLGEVWGAILGSMMTGARVAFDSKLLEVEAETGARGYVWAQTMGLWMMGMGTWSGELSIALGVTGEDAELALGVMRGVVGGAVVNQAWYRRVSQEMRAAARATMRSVRREIQHMREIREMVQSTFSDVNRMHMESFYADLRESVREVHGWSNVLGGTIDVRDPETGDVFNVEDVASEYWINESGDVIVGVDSPLLADELEAEGWRRMEKSLDGFPEQFDFT